MKDWSFSLCVIVPQFRGYMTLWGGTQLSSFSPLRPAVPVPVICEQKSPPNFQTSICSNSLTDNNKTWFYISLQSLHDCCDPPVFYFYLIDSKLMYRREWKFSAYFVFYTCWKFSAYFVFHSCLFSLIKKSERGLAVVTLHEREPSK